MKLGLVSAKYPFGSKEAYLDTELRALAPSLEKIVVFPLSPDTRERGYHDIPAEIVNVPLAGLQTFVAGARAALRNPGATLRALGAVLGDRYPLRVKLKNVAVFPKALALADLIRRRGLDHVHAYWLSTPATAAWVAARIAGISFSATAHRWDVYENNMAARKVREAAFIRTISERGRRDLLQRTGGDPAKIDVVRLGVRLPARRWVPVVVGDSWGRLTADRPVRILCAAAFVPVKGHSVLLAALAMLRDSGVPFACSLAGEGPLRDEVAHEIEAAGLGSSVRLIGSVPHDVLLEALQNGDYDLAVIASVERPGGLMEGVPVALIEAMAAGAVVVATDSGSVNELVDAATGVLVPHSDPRALYEGIARVARDPELRDRLRHAARLRVERDFDVSRTTERLRELFEAV